MNAPAAARTIDDRLGEALRRAKLGSVRPLWEHLQEPIRRQWRQDANTLLVTARNCGLKIEEANTP